MEFRILGPTAVIDDDDRPVVLPAGHGRALLALLVLHAGEVVSTDRLLDELWGEAPPLTAATALQGLVSFLRKRLEPARVSRERPIVLVTDPPGYRLAIDPDAVDANRFRRLVDEASGAVPAEKAAKLRYALHLWRGPPLAEFTYEPFAQAPITALEELRLTVIEELVDSDLMLGRHAEQAAELQDLVAQHPLRERLRGQLMLCLYRSGRQADALQAYHEARRAMVDELGIEPGPSLQQLEQAILRQDPWLDAAGPAPLPASASVAIESWLPQVRHLITAVVVDLDRPADEPGTLDPEALERIIGGFVDTAAGILTRRGALVERFIGDAVVGAFGAPYAHEDDALRAARAAVELQRDLAVRNGELERAQGVRLTFRIGISTGEAVVRNDAVGHAAVSGDVVRSAARLGRAAGEAEVLLDASTRRLIREAAHLQPVEHLSLWGEGSAAAAWRLVGLDSGAPAVARRLDAPLVGRSTELARLRNAFERTVARRAGYRFTVLGDAGIGKSRLVSEFTEGLGPGVLALTGRCPAYGDGITFAPLREVVVQAAGTGGAEALAELVRKEDDGEWIAAEVAGAIGLTREPGRPDQLFPAVRRLFEALAGRQPVIVTLEDVHWAEPTLLDLVEYLADRGRGPILLLCVARPELVEERPAWGAGGRNVDTLFLDALDEREMEQLIADRVEGQVLPPETLVRIIETAQGNPLFAEQMVAAFEHDGAISIPPSVEALLAARIDRLGPAERDLLRCAAVIGTDFAEAALMALAPQQAHPFVGRHLRSLDRKQLLAAMQSPVGGFQFRHALIQLAAYRSVTLEDRARLHLRYAGWLEGEAAHPPLDLDESVGYHLEQAVKSRRALGPPSERDVELATRAGGHLADAAARAFTRFDITAVENLLSRSKSLLPPGHPRRPEVLRRLADAYPVLGRHATADEVLAELLDDPSIRQDRRQEQDIQIERALIRLTTGPDPTSLDAIRRQAERALDESRSSDDDAGAAHASHLLGLALMRAGTVREMAVVSDAGLVHAERSGQPREEAALRWWVAWAARAGEMPVGDAIHVCEPLVPWRGSQHPGVLCELATLRAMAGDLDDARQLIARARKVLVERMRARRPLMFVAQSSAAVEVLAGELPAAERELRTALDMALEMGERDQISLLAARLSRVLSARERCDEAERYATISAERAPAESVAAQALWRAAEAAVVASHGGYEKAIQLAREAVEMAPAEMPNFRADLLVDLAGVLRASGNGEPEPLIREAMDLYASKGNVVAAAWSRALVGSPS